jgi:RNA polymerase sigma-70 factor (ECF subfamily)
MRHGQGCVFLAFGIFFGTVSSLYPFIIAMTGEIGKKRIQRQTTLAFSEDATISLIQRACSDPDAFAQLYLSHYDYVFHYCVRRLFDRHCAEDVTSTVFWKVMHNLGSFDGNTIDFRHWLLRIATNAVNDHLRDAKRRADATQRIVRNSRAESVFVIGGDDELLEKKALLRQALLSLKPRYQTVITLRFFENMKLIEIATCLGKNPSTVRTWLTRATAKLRKKLDAAMNSRG